MINRRYRENVVIKSKELPFTVNIAAGGAAYVNVDGTMRKMDSIFFKLTGFWMLSYKEWKILVIGYNKETKEFKILVGNEEKGIPQTFPGVFTLNKTENGYQVVRV